MPFLFISVLEAGWDFLRGKRIIIIINKTGKEKKKPFLKVGEGAWREVI